ncbi:MAG: prepilin-type N-terminal cleavage/methylation domain-containing protein [Mariprofundus sp.]
MHPCQRPEAGFTLIEMMMALAMGLIIIAGLSAMFVTNSRVTESFTSRTERMGDLYLASQLMQSDLRGSRSTLLAPPFPVDLQAGGRLLKVKGVCTATTASVSLPGSYPTSFPYLPYWDAASNTLTYQDLDGNTGIFQYQRGAKDRIYWLRPDPCVSKFQELMRNLDTANGIVVIPTSPGGIVDVTLQSNYQTGNHQNAPLTLSFKLWPRN